jgi:hypothetical protein
MAGKSINVYIKKKDETIISEGKNEGINPSYALVEGYKYLMGKSARYSALDKERNNLIQRLAEVESEMDSLKEDIVIDPDLRNEVIIRLRNAYLRENDIPPIVMKNNRIKLGLGKAEFKQLIQEQVISPIDKGEIDATNISSV